MRRNYISPEYTKLKIWGSFNMIEESNFFSSKMMDIQDFIELRNEDIIYYQNPDREQLDFSVESSLSSYVFSTNGSKDENHTLILDESQSQSQRNSNARWILTISHRKILSDYIFSSIKKYRTFQGMTNEMTVYDDVNIAIQRYVEFNVLDRYQLKEVQLYLRYRRLDIEEVLKFETTWNPNIDSESNRIKKIQTQFSQNKDTVKLIFNQEQDSSNFSFDYYYNLYFEKI